MSLTLQVYAVAAAPATRCRYVFLESVQWVGGTSPPDPVPVPRSTYEDAMTDRQTVSIRKACGLVAVSRRTIYNWLASGKVEYVRTAGGSVRILVDTLWRTPDDTAISRWDSGEAAAASPQTSPHIESPTGRPTVARRISQ